MDLCHKVEVLRHPSAHRFSAAADDEGNPSVQFGGRALLSRRDFGVPLPEAYIRRFACPVNELRSASAFAAACESR